MEQRNLVKYQEKSNEILRQANEVKVKSQEGLNYASDKIKEIKEVAKRIKEEKENYTKPAREIIENANRKYNPILTVCEEVERVLKNKSAQYIFAEKHKAEAKRIKLLEKAQSGKMKEETAVKKLSEIKDVKAQTDKSSLRVSTRKEVEIVDVNLIPREFMVPDLKKIKAQLLAENEVKGARLIEKQVISSI